jgi:hypothetical protein
MALRLKDTTAQPHLHQGFGGEWAQGKKIQEGLIYNMTKQNGNYYLRKP